VTPQSAVVLSKHTFLQQRFKMFVADVKCSQATWQTVPNSQASSAKASVEWGGLIYAIQSSRHINILLY